MTDESVCVSFLCLQGRTSVKRNSYNPMWNEQIVFTEMFPPLCQRIKIQLKESDTVSSPGWLYVIRIDTDDVLGLLAFLNPELSVILILIVP